MNKKDIIIILVIVFVGLLATLIIYLSVHAAKKTPPTTTGGGSGPSNTGGGNVPNPPQTGYNASCPPEFPLKFGSSNDYVGQLQQYLLKADATCLPAGVDSVWGNDMESCVQRVLGTNLIGCELYFNSLGLS